MTYCARRQRGSFFIHLRVLLLGLELKGFKLYGVNQYLALPAYHLHTVQLN